MTITTASPALSEVSHSTGTTSTAGHGGLHHVTHSFADRYVQSHTVGGKIRIDIDETLVRIGEFGRAQWALYLLLVGAWLPSAMITMLPVFTNATPQWECTAAGFASGLCIDARGAAVAQAAAAAAGANRSAVVDLTRAPLASPCGLPDAAYWQYRNYDTIVASYDLMCGAANGWAIQIGTSLFFVGVLAGSGWLGGLADKYGRKPIFFWSSVAAGVACAGAAAAPWYWLYVTARFGAGFGTGGLAVLAFVWPCEMIGPKWRGISGTLTAVLFSFGTMLLAGVAALVPGWRWLTILSAVVQIVWALMALPAPESPRYLLAQGKEPAARAVMEKLAHWNGVKWPENIELIDSAGNSTKQVQHGSLRDVCGNRLVRNRTLIMMLSWFANCCAYYGLSLNAGNLGTEVHVSLFFSGAVEVPAYFTAAFLLDRPWAGRKRTIISYMLVGGISCLICVFLHIPPECELQSVSCGVKTARTAVSMIGKFCVAAAFIVDFVYTAELYPTVVRSLAMGMCSLSARIGGILSPFALYGEVFMPTLPFLLFGVLATAAGLLMLRLPETLGLPLPESFEDMLHSQRLRDRKHQHELEEAQLEMADTPVTVSSEVMDPKLQAALERDNRSLLH